MKIIPEIFISGGKRPKKSIAQNLVPKKGLGPEKSTFFRIIKT